MKENSRLTKTLHTLVFNIIYITGGLLCMFHRAGAVKASCVLVACEPEGNTAPNVKGIRPRARVGQIEGQIALVLFPVLGVTPKFPAASTNTQAIIAPSLIHRSPKMGEDQMSKSGYGWLASSRSPIRIARRS